MDQASLKLLKRESPRSDYPATLDALRSGLAESQVFVGLYKTLFRATTHRELFRYLGIPEQIPDLSHRVNTSQATTSVPPELLHRLSRNFAPLVTFWQDRCPDVKFEQHWATAMT